MNLDLTRTRAHGASGKLPPTFRNLSS